MTEWWTYRLSDFLMFSARTYHRLFELYNADLWPLPVVAFIGGALWMGIAWRHRRVSAWPTPVALAALAAAWLWVAWAFHLERYATINTAAPFFAAAFVLEALLLIAVAGVALRRRTPLARGGRLQWGFGLLALAILGYPWLGVLLGRPLSQTEVLGIAPDPTAVGTLGVLLLVARGHDSRARRRVVASAWPIPLVWCGISGATLWTMDAPEAPLLAGARADRCGGGDQDAPLERRCLIEQALFAGRAAPAVRFPQVRPVGGDEVRTSRGSSAPALSRATRSAPPSATTRVPTAIDCAWWKTRLLPSSMRTRMS
jgi:hypothetical protein